MEFNKTARIQTLRNEIDRLDRKRFKTLTEEIVATEMEFELDELLQETDSQTKIEIENLQSRMDDLRDILAVREIPEGHEIREEIKLLEREIEELEAGENSGFSIFTK